MSGTAGTTALGARTIVGMVSSYPSLVGSVISQVVIVLGSKYTGRATRQAVDTYGTFVFRLAIISVVFAFCLAAAFFFAAETIFAFYSKDPAIVKECKSVTPLVVASIALSVGSSVVGGVVFAAQEFGFLTVINIATQFLVYLPAIIVVENKHFGEITLFRLMLPNFLQALVVTVFQVILIVTKVRPELARLAAQDAGVARTEQGVEMGQTVVLTSAGVVT